MRFNKQDLKSLKSSSVFITKSKRGIPYLPGLLLLGLGIVLLIAPKLVLGALAFCLLTFGALMCYATYKISMFRKQVNTLAKNMESSFFTAGMRGSKPDIEVSEESESKIVFH